MFNYMGMNPEQVLEGVKKFGPAVGARKIIDWEYQHAQEALERGIYVTYWCDMKQTECGRIGSNSKCFCGHFFKDHKLKLGKKLDTACENCPCKFYSFVPTRPEECGMYWLPRRKDFKVYEWRAKCKCKHSHEEHNPNRPFKCLSCHNCHGFHSDFACISCDQAWENHEVLYETEDERRMSKKPIRQAFLPLSDNQELHGLVFNPTEEQLAQRSLEYSRPHPTNTNNNSVVVRPKPTSNTMKISKAPAITKPKGPLSIEEQQPTIGMQAYDSFTAIPTRAESSQNMDAPFPRPSSGLGTRSGATSYAKPSVSKVTKPVMSSTKSGMNSITKPSITSSVSKPASNTTSNSGSTRPSPGLGKKPNTSAYDY